MMARYVAYVLVGAASLGGLVAPWAEDLKDDPAACASGRNTSATYCIPTDYTEDFTELYKKISARTEPPDPTAPQALSQPEKKPLFVTATVPQPVLPSQTARPVTVVASPAPVVVSASSWVGKFISAYTSLMGGPAPVSPVVNLALLEAERPETASLTPQNAAYKPCWGQGRAEYPQKQEEIFSSEGNIFELEFGRQSPLVKGATWQTRLVFADQPVELAQRLLTPGGEAQVARLLPKTTAWSCQGQAVTEANQDLVQGMCQQFAEVTGTPDERMLVCD